MAPLIEVEKMGYRVGSRHLLRDISLEVKQGEQWVVFGMNGSGKTTLLSILAGFNAPTSGSLRLFGEPVNERNILEVRKRIGFVSSSFFDKFYSCEKASEIVLSGLEGTFIPHGRPSRKDIVLMMEWGRRLKIEDLLDKPYRLLSKGEQQKILLARAFIGSPEILLLDEPYSGLDLLMRENLKEILVKEAYSRGIAIMQVTHRLEDVDEGFAKTMLLKDGIVFDQGPSAQMLSDETLALFLQRFDGAFDASVESVAVGDNYITGDDHDSDAARTAGQLVSLGFLGEEIALYGVSWCASDGVPHASVSTSELRMMDFIERAKKENLLISSPEYRSIRFENIPSGWREHYERQLSESFAVDLKKSYPQEFFDGLRRLRGMLELNPAASTALDGFREELRDRFDPGGIQLFEQLLDDAAECGALSDAEVLLHRKWLLREKRKISETRRGMVESPFNLAGFVYWRAGVARAVVNSNRWELALRKRMTISQGFATSPIVKRVVEGPRDFTAKRQVRKSFESSLLSLSSSRLMPFMVAVHSREASTETRIAFDETLKKLKEAGLSKAAESFIYYGFKWHVL